MNQLAVAARRVASCVANQRRPSAAPASLLKPAAATAAARVYSRGPRPLMEIGKSTVRLTAEKAAMRAG